MTSSWYRDRCIWIPLLMRTPNTFNALTRINGKTYNTNNITKQTSQGTINQRYEYNNLEHKATRTSGRNQNRIQQTTPYTYDAIGTALPVGHDSPQDEQQLDHRQELVGTTCTLHHSEHRSTQLKAKTNQYRQLSAGITQQPKPKVSLTIQQSSPTAKKHQLLSHSFFKTERSKHSAGRACCVPSRRVPNTGEALASVTLAESPSARIPMTSPSELSPKSAIKFLHKR